MIPNQPDGLVKKQKLSESEITAIQQLNTICEEYDGLHTRIWWDMLKSRPGSIAHDFLYYEDGILVGYLALDAWGDEEKELIGIVHPEHRRKGIFRTLLAAAKEESAQTGTKRLVLICEATSQSGQAFVEAVGARYDFSEHEMVLEDFQERYVFDERFSFRPADSSDLDALVHVKATSFGDSEDAIRPMVVKWMQDPNRYYYLATFGEGSVSCKEPIGCLRLDEGEREVGIYAFGVLPEYRGRGYGRQMLEEAIRIVRARSQKTIMLDVDTTNTNAIGLYRSCGFRIKTTYDYYVIDI